MQQHLRSLQPEFRESTDAVLAFGGASFLVHSQLLSYKSAPLCTLFRLTLPEGRTAAAASGGEPAGLPLVVLSPESLPEEINDVSVAAFELFLEHTYSPAAIRSVGEACMCFGAVSEPPEPATHSPGLTSARAGGGGRSPAPAGRVLWHTGQAAVALLQAAAER